MKKFNTSPISGAQELLPALQQEFDRLKSEINRIYLEHGFLHIETPVIERTEVLLAKAGGDTEKQIYKLVKTNETAKDADQALRFDHTVPLARYAAMLLWEESQYRAPHRQEGAAYLLALFQIYRVLVSE